MTINKTQISLTLLLGLSLFFLSCSQKSFESNQNLKLNPGGNEPSDNGSSQVTPTPNPTPDPVTTPSPTPMPSPAPIQPPPTNPPQSYKVTPLLWEKYRPLDGADWTQYIFLLLKGELHAAISNVKDMETFCPNYKKLSDDEKINAFAMMVSGITKYESAFSPTSRMKETTLGTDDVTGLPVYSEGLLQLSYGDIEGYSYCKFDWNKDKHLDPEDPNKTILNPYTNLDCGLRILADQIKRKGTLVLSSGVYWATLKQGGKYTKISEIANDVKKAMPICYQTMVKD